MENINDLVDFSTIVRINTELEVNYDYISNYDIYGYDINEYSLVIVSDMIAALDDSAKMVFAFECDLFKLWIKENRNLRLKVIDILRYSNKQSLKVQVTEIPSSTAIDFDNKIRGYVTPDENVIDFLEKMDELGHLKNAEYSFYRYVGQQVTVTSKDDPTIRFQLRCQALYDLLKEQTSISGILSNIISGFPVTLEFIVGANANSSTNLPVQTYEPHFMIHYEYENKKSYDRTFNKGNFSTKIVGMKFHDYYERIRETLSVGDKVTISLDPDNIYDEDALKVTHNNELIGYIPKKHKPAVLLFLKRRKLEAIVEEINLDEDHILIRIFPEKKDFIKKYITKYKIYITKTEKTKINGQYIESMSLASFDDLVEYL